ncbi:MAG: alpha/beta fold hydrolase [Aquamicrobium sp.]|uniref:alpha/beta fold hydrolase n=1 Tax=Aquamicrobium sp. TaxID=1872579 RepID=UPI00349EF96D|nr:alpha/beta fold hydrolase [Aquamicrobium sp.]
MLATLTAIAAALLAAVLLVATYYFQATRRISRDAEHAVPPRGRFVAVEGCDIHYVERGEGRPILFIHGLGGTLHHMRRPLMEEFGDGYRLIALDRPGSGYSTRPSRFDGRLSEQARLIAGFIDALALERPLLVGHSLGGAVALATTLLYPERIAGLALIAPLTQHEDKVAPEFRGLDIPSPLLRRIVSETLAVPTSVKMAAQTLDFVFGPQKPPHDYAVAGGAMAGLRPSHFFATSTDLVALRHDMPGIGTRYGEIGVPAGILFGSADRVLDHKRHGTGMEGRIAGLDIEIMEGVGHMPQYADTSRVVAFIRRIAERAFAA